jgi:hypothetical protein
VGDVTEARLCASCVFVGSPPDRDRKHGGRAQPAQAAIVAGRRRAGAIMTTAATVTTGGDGVLGQPSTST